MVFIDKSTQHSQESKQRLEDWKKVFSYTGETLEQLYAKAESGVLTGREIWTIFRTKGIDVQDRLREDLSIEQAHICCYCGQKLKIDTRIEHFLSKAKEFAKRIFNYNNLLLSCEGELYDRVQYSNGKRETLTEFADRNELTTKQVRAYNPNNNFKNFKVGDKIRLGKDHCDPHKGHIEDKEKKEIPIINPTTHSSCWKYFKFDYEGGISVNDKQDDETIKTLASNSIRVLNLDVEELRNLRKKAREHFEDELQTQIDFVQDFDIEAYFSDQLKTKQPFCFVNYYYIQPFTEK